MRAYMSALMCARMHFCLYWGGGGMCVCVFAGSCHHAISDFHITN